MKTITCAHPRGPFTVAASLLAILLACPGRILLADQQGEDAPHTAQPESVSALISEVRQGVQSREHSKRVLQAVKKLGEMQSTEAIDLLVDNIPYPLFIPADVKPTPPSREDALAAVRAASRPRFVSSHTLQFGRPDRVYPLAKALVSIGAPCVPKVTQKLLAADNKWEMQACLGVLLRLKGPDATLAVVDDALVKAETPEERKHFERILVYLTRILDISREAYQREFERRKHLKAE